jgi:hypothetical protein
MSVDLQEIGERIQAGYASSIAEGHAAWTGHVGPGMQVFHVPAMRGDGTPIDPSMLAGAADAEVVALAKISCRITVDAVRHAGDDLLILEAVYTGVLPNGDDFSYPNVLLFTFVDGAIARIVEVASAEMWSTLARALRDAAGYTGTASQS